VISASAGCRGVIVRRKGKYCGVSRAQEFSEACNMITDLQAMRQSSAYMKDVTRRGALYASTTLSPISSLVAFPFHTHIEQKVRWKGIDNDILTERKRIQHL
jgi:hypothetical protein